MKENRIKTDKRVWLGGAFIFLGLLFFFNSMNILHFSI